MYLEEESKPIKKMCEKLMDAVNYELDKGVENIDTKELGEAIDMIKDLYEAKKEMYESCYYKQIMEAMEEHDFEDEEEIADEGRKGYRGQPRDSKGRYMSRRGRRMGYEEPIYMSDMYPMEHYRDMDRMDGRMYYTSGSMGNNSMGSQGQSSNSSSNMSGNRGYSDRMVRDGREGRSGERRKGYMEAKEQGMDKQAKMKELEEYMKELSSDVTEMISDASQEEKTMLKNKMQVLMQKIQ